jgi:hypothetical protein
VRPGRAVGHLRSAGGDGVNDSGALQLVSTDSLNGSSGCAYGGAVVSLGSSNGGHDGSGDD